MFTNLNMSIILIASIAAGGLGLIFLILGVVFFILNAKANAKYRAQAANNSVPEVPVRDVPPSQPVMPAQSAAPAMSAAPAFDTEKTMSLYANQVPSADGDSTVMLFNGQAKAKTTFVKLISCSSEPGLQGEYKAAIYSSVVIGRKEGDIVISVDNSISSRHCEITKRESQFFIRDLGSSNGTCLNGAPVTAEVPIKIGDTLRLGRGDYIIVIEEE